MIRRAALPALICVDCGHDADHHRDPLADPPTCTGGDGTCVCARTRQAINHHAADVAAEQQAERKRLGAALLASMALTLAVGFGSVLASRALAGQAVRQSEQKLCSIVVLSDDAYRRTPPSTPTGQQLADNFTRLRRDLRCTPAT